MTTNTTTDNNSNFYKCVWPTIDTLGGMGASAILAYGGYNLIEKPNIENALLTTFGYSALRVFIFSGKHCGDYTTTTDKVITYGSYVGLVSCVAYRYYKYGVI